MPSGAKTAIIIGGGIGGLTTAIALRRGGIDAQVYERAPELREVGAGLTLWANAVKALRRLGLADVVQAAGQPGLGGSIRTWRGDILTHIAAADLEARYGAANVAIHRADLQSVLLKALGDERVHLGAECTRFRQDETGVTAQFTDGREARADFLVGADGIHSVVRRQLFGQEKIRYSGYTAWRGVATVDESVVPPGAGFEAWGRGRRFGVVPVGGGRVYWFATKNTRQNGKDAPAGRKAELLTLFRGWLAPVEALIEATDEAAILRNDIVDRKTIREWTNRRVTLLGDAAHPMTPNLGQGACQAIEDAVMLPQRLQAMDDVESGLRSYELRRLQRANFIVRVSRQVGNVAQWSLPGATDARNLMMRTLGRRFQIGQLDFLLGYEP
ncbi:MAG: FAD-dependent monooxygenase [Anaerolineae bacterium]